MPPFPLPPGRAASRAGHRGSVVEALPMILVALLAVGVVTVTFFIVHRTGLLLDSIAVQTETIRSHADRVQTSVGRESMALQSYLLAPDSAFRAEHTAARAAEDSAMTRLEQDVGRAGATSMSGLSNLRLILRRWHRVQDDLLSGAIDAGAYRAGVNAQGARFDDVITSLAELKGEAAFMGAARREEIKRLQRFGALLTTFLAVATLIAAVFAHRFRGGIRESAQELVIRAREAEEAVRTRDDVLAIVSHDLRNALNAMSGAVAVAQEEGLSAERRAQQLALATRSARGMRRLISDLLDAARMEQGNLSVEPGPVSVQELVGQAEEGHAFDAERCGVALVVHSPEEPLWVRADGERVTQVLGNLIGNALKFTPEGGSVIVDVSSDADRVSFSVTDTGPGIPREHLPHIFDRFYQVSTTGQAGAGLGLAIAQGLVEAHGSKLEVTSRPGEGTTFEFDLPRISPTMALAPKVASGGRG